MDILLYISNMITKIIQISSSYCDRTFTTQKNKDHIKMNTRLHRNREIYFSNERDIYIWRISWDHCFLDFLINSFQKMMK